MGNRFDEDSRFVRTEAYGNRELKYYKDIYGNDVRLMTTKEKSIVNKILVISSVFIVVLMSGLFYKAYLVRKEVEERTQLYLMAGEELEDGKDIVASGGVLVSEDEEIIEVESDGTLVAKGSGTTNVTVYKNIEEDGLFDEKINNSGKLLLDKYNNLGIKGEFTFEVVVKQKVTGVKNKLPVINLNVGVTEKMLVDVFPYSAYDKSLLFSSSDSGVVSVDSNGILSAKSEGSAVITVTTKDGGFSDSTLVKVTKKDSYNSILASVNNNDLEIGNREKISVVIYPDEKLKEKLVYSSSNSSIASVNANGEIVAKKSGKVVITVRVSGEKLESKININVLDKKVEKINVQNRELWLNINDNLKLNTYIYPSDIKEKLIFSSSNGNIVSVDSDGNIKALKEGSSVISVRSSNNILVNTVVHVKKDFNKATNIIAGIEKEKIEVGEKTKIIASVLPENAYNKNVSYISTNEDIVKVDNDGNVIGVNHGEANIIVSNSGGIVETVKVIVKDTYISVDRIDMTSYINIKAFESTKIKTLIEPHNSTNKKIVWSSSDNSIVRVDDNGVITGLKSGSCVVTAKIDSVSQSVSVNVVDVQASDLELNYQEGKILIGDTLEIKGTLYPANTTNKNIIWSSSNEDVVVVKDGKITAVGEGKAVITALSESNLNIKEYVYFEVEKVDVESFRISHSEVLVTKNKEVKLSINNVLPENASFKKATYVIDDPSIAKVSSDGVVTGLKEGKTNISVTVDGIVKTLNVTVFKEGDKVYFIDTFENGVESDAILLESNGKYAMIDTGSTSSSINTVRFLKDLGVKRLEFILITNFNSRNFGAIYGENPANNILLSGIKVGKVYMKPYSSSDSRFGFKNNNLDEKSIKKRRDLREDMYINLRENIVDNNIGFVTLDENDKYLNLVNFDINLYNLSDQLKSYKNECLENGNCHENSNSIVSLVSVNNRYLYLSSNIYNANNGKKTDYLKEKTEEKIAKEIMSVLDSDIDIYKASNYGYSTSNVSKALSRIKPKYSIVTNVKENIKNEKSLEIIDKYTDKDIMYVGDGTIVVNIDKDSNIDFMVLD